MGTSLSSLPAPGPPMSVHHSRTPSAARRRAETQDSDKAGRVWAREVDEPWWPCILALDGGGIRGYSSLLILKALMHEVWEWECYFARMEEETRSSGEGGGEERGMAGVGAEGRGRTESPTEMRGGAEMDGSDGARDEEAASRVESKYGIEDAAPSQAAAESAPAEHTLHQDDITPNITIRKAMSEEELLPCHYFDFLYGTSTGGLIATMLGRLRMTVSEALALYERVGQDLFGKRRSHIPLTTKYHHQPLEKAVQDLVGARCHEHENCDGKSDLHPWDSSEEMEERLRRSVPFDVEEPRLCQSCCLTATHDENISEAYLLRTYPHYYSDAAPNWITRYNEGADPLPIWTVTRATSAAPFYFEMVTHEVDGVVKSFKDGGIRENNPSGAALSEFHALYAEGKAERPALLLSVGTGRPDQTQDGFADAWPGAWGKIPLLSKFLEKRAVVQNLLIKYTEGEKQHHQMREHAHGEHTWYKRLNVSEGLEGMPLDDWRKGEFHGRKEVEGGATLSRMEEATRAYLDREFDPRWDSYAPPATMVRQAAEKLVRVRRAREREGGRRWAVFIGADLHKKAKKANQQVQDGAAG